MTSTEISRDYSTLTFDCYGTLIDWETGILAGLRPLRDRHPGAPGDDELLEIHARHESRQQSRTPAMLYSRLLAVVYRRVAEELGIPASWEECEHYGKSVRNWPAFPDSHDSLRRLKERFSLVILSNVDNASFAHSNRLLNVAFTAIYTAEDIGSYKPDPANFHYMLQNLADNGTARKDILHVAESMFHDHVPANSMSLSNCWIHRRWQKGGYGATSIPENDAGYLYRFTSMAEFADAILGT